MSIAIPTYAPGAIASYSDLVAEIRDMMDDANYGEASIIRAIRKAEAHFNRELRTPEMETRAVLSITAELTPLPADFIELRYIFQEGAPDSPLNSMSPAGMLATYAGRSGAPMAYTLEGGSLRIGPVGPASLEMVYYRRIDPLSDAQVSNWLLRDHPDLYVAGVMFHLARRERDGDGALQSGQEVAALIQAVKGEAARNRWGAGPLVPVGIGQVRRVAM